MTYFRSERLDFPCSWSKTHSFFDSFPVFPVGAKSGAEAKSQSMFRDTRTEGAATVYSEALVEANRRLLRGKIESRGVSPVCPVGRQARSPSSNDRALRPARKRRGRSGKGLNSEPPAEMNRVDNHLGTLNFCTTHEILLHRNRSVQSGVRISDKRAGPVTVT